MIYSPTTNTRLILMDTPTAKDALVDRYVVMLQGGIPRGALPPFRRWVVVLASDMKMDQQDLMEEIRSAALVKYKLQCHR